MMSFFNEASQPLHGVTVTWSLLLPHVVIFGFTGIDTYSANGFVFPSQSAFTSITI